MSFFEELKRRNVFRVGIAYAVAAWLLLQLADVLSELLDLPAEVGPLVVTVVLIGFPVVLLAAWAFELTPEGIKRESEVDRKASITQKTGRKLDRVITVTLAIAVAYLLVDKLVLRDSDAPTASSDTTTQSTSDDAAEALNDASVAVLPFRNMSGDPENEYFSDGLTDTLLHMLAQLPDLRVAARTSSFAFKDQDPTIDEVAATLNVAHILEGSVQRAGGQVRVTAQLIRADDGFHMWSQNYTRPLEDIFAIQDEIATDVAGALGASLGVAGEAVIQGLETESLDAYDHYLHGLEQQAIASYPSLDAAEDSFKQALVLDATFTDARMALVRNYFKMRLTGMLTNEELQQAARPLLDQVLREDPDNRLAPLFDYMLTTRFADRDVLSFDQLRQDLEHIRGLLERAPTESFMRAEIAAGFAAALDDYDAALEILDTGLLIDPLEPLLYLEQGRIYVEMENYDEAERAYLRGIELRPEMPTGYGLMSGLKQRTGDYPASLDWMRRTIALDPQDHELPDGLAWEFYSLDMPEEAERWYARVQALAPGSAVARSLEVERAHTRGETEQALELAWRAIEDRIDMRRGAHDTVVRIYARLMLASGQAREAFERIGAFRPEVHRWSELPPDGRDWDLQWYSFILYADFATAEERLAAWSELTTALDATGFPWREPGSNVVTVDALVQGDIDTAVENYFERRFNRPVSRSPRAHWKIPGALYQPLYDDPRVIAAISQREAEFETARAEVQAMLQSEAWTDP